MRHYVGLDISLNETAICVVDEDGIIIREGKAPSDPGAISTWLAELGFAVAKVGLAVSPAGFTQSCELPDGQPSASILDACEGSPRLCP